MWKCFMFSFLGCAAQGSVRIVPSIPLASQTLRVTEKMFVAPKTSATAAKTGPRQWKSGDRLWDLHVPLPKMLTRNLSSVVFGDQGTSNAGTLGLHKPEVALDAHLFGEEVMRVQKSELCNRLAIGLSMLVGSLVSLKVKLEEAASTWMHRLGGEA